MVDALRRRARSAQTEVMALIGLNTDLRREYIADCAGGVKRWNRILAEAGLPQRLYLPHIAFNRKVGAFAAHRGVPVGRAADRRRVGARARDSGCPPTPTRLSSGR